MASLILAIAALLLSALGLVIALAAFYRANCAHDRADHALDSVALLDLSPDAVFTAEDGEEFEFRVGRAN